MTNFMNTKLTCSPFLHFSTVFIVVEDIFVVMLAHINRGQNVAAEIRNKRVANLFKDTCTIHYLTHLFVADV